MKTDTLVEMNQKVKQMLSSVLINFLLFVFAQGRAALQSSNTPLKIIRTDYGDVYECIDANKQPSLLHPALKAHKVQGLSIEDNRNQTSRVAGLGLDEGCPLGSVPIRRMSKIISTNVARGFDPTARFAGFVTKQTVPRLHPINGVFAAYNIHNPKVGDTQRSSAVMALESDVGGHLSRVEAGWMVSPGTFGDNRTRLYAGWVEASKGTITGCYNTGCQGFIVTSRVTPLGVAFPYHSDPGGRQFDVTFDIFLENGLWKLTVNGEELGYWPSEIVPNLNPYTLKVRWGGEVLKPDPNDATRPEMGDGQFRRKWPFTFMAYVRQIALHRGKFTWKIPRQDELDKFWFNCYRTASDGYTDEADLGYSFAYGGKDADFNHNCKITL